MENTTFGGFYQPVGSYPVSHHRLLPRFMPETLLPVYLII